MTTEGATTACPICEYECAAPEDVRFHLHTRHPKSELVDTLVATDEWLDDGAADADRESADTDGESTDVDTLIAR